MNIDLENLAKKINKELKQLYGIEMGFFLSVFEFHKPGVADYISNAERKNIIKALRETADRFERNEIIPKPKGEA